MDLLKISLIIAGTLSLVIGLAGVVIPGVPTTPFLLLTAGLYMRSSGTLYQRFLAIKWINGYLSAYKRNKGMTRKVKISVIVFMWAMISASCLFFIHSDAFKIIVILLGLTGTYVMGIVVPTATLTNNKQ